MDNLQLFWVSVPAKQLHRQIVFPVWCGGPWLVCTEPWPQPHPTPLRRTGTPAVNQTSLTLFKILKWGFRRVHPTLENKMLKARTDAEFDSRRRSESSSEASTWSQMLNALACTWRWCACVCGNERQIICCSLTEVFVNFLKNNTRRTLKKTTTLEDFFFILTLNYLMKEYVNIINPDQISSLSSLLLLVQVESIQ